MPNIISKIEDALLGLCKLATPNVVKSYGSAPADWSEQIATQLLQRAPGIFVAFHGYTKRDGYFQGPKKGRFLIFCLTADGNEDQRRRGDNFGIGSYELVSAVDTALDGVLLHDNLSLPIGTLSVGGCDNLFTTALWDMGGTCYGLSVELMFEFDTPVDGSMGILAEVDTNWDAAHVEPDDTHTRWLADDLTNPAPDAQDKTILPQ